jgi:hypothetical protein
MCDSSNFKLVKIKKNKFKFIKNYAINDKKDENIDIYIHKKHTSIRIAHATSNPDDVYYLKYIHSNPLSFIQFSIIFFKKIDKRFIVKILSNDFLNDKMYIFYCYTSISDGSFWRFCITNDKHDYFEKGNKKLYIS